MGNNHTETHGDWTVIWQHNIVRVFHQGKKVTGCIVYNGPTQLEGKSGNIVGILTWNSANKKTGDMAQLWIVPADVHPSKARSTGQDQVVCGDCKFAGRNGCYVSDNSFLAIWRNYREGKYPDCNPKIAGLLINRKGLRLGAYGEPTALPLETVQQLADGAKFQTGYTHTWKNCHPMFKYLLNASVDSPEERSLADEKGWRTFRVKRPDEPLIDNERACPASEEMGFRTQCRDCRLCDGVRADVAINAHGYQLTKTLEAIT